jgi:hypothetical protein
MPTVDRPIGARVTSEDIRAHVVAHWLGPARRAGQRTFTVRIGDIMRDLSGITGVNQPCSALRSPSRFQEPNGVTLIADEGPPSGMGYNVELTYRFDRTGDPREGGPEHGEAEHPSLISRLLTMRGVGRESYERHGGGDAVLDKVREGWE